MSCPKCGHKQQYIKKYPPKYILDESRGMVCERCGWDEWGECYFRKQKLSIKQKKIEK